MRPGSSALKQTLMLNNSTPSDPTRKSRAVMMFASFAAAAVWSAPDWLAALPGVGVQQLSTIRVASVVDILSPMTYMMCRLVNQMSVMMQAPTVKVDQAGPPIEDLKLGQLIVKTRKGRLFRGTYQGSPAAIKVST